MGMARAAEDGVSDADGGGQSAVRDGRASALLRKRTTGGNRNERASSQTRSDSMKRRSCVLIFEVIL